VTSHNAVTLDGQLAVAVHAVPKDWTWHVLAVARPVPDRTAVTQHVGAAPLQSDG
jgi:hypothetical protein